jgi:hypothetical protein
MSWIWRHFGVGDVVGVLEHTKLQRKIVYVYRNVLEMNENERGHNRRYHTTGQEGCGNNKNLPPDKEYHTMIKKTEWKTSHHGTVLKKSTASIFQTHLNYKYRYVSVGRTRQHKLCVMSEFDVHGSAHIGNVRVYVRLRAQLDVHGFICILYSSIFCFTCFGCYLHPSSGAQTAAYSHRYVQWWWYVNPLEQVLAGTPSHF